MICNWENNLWDRLKNQQRPIVIYGTGNGADRVFEMCDARGIPVKGVYSSDDRITNKPFHGYEVKGINQAANDFCNPIVILAFGTEKEDVLEQIHNLTKKYDVVVPDIPLTGGPCIDEAYVHENYDKILAAESLFADEQSKKVFNSLFEFKCSGNPYCLFDIETSGNEKKELFQFDSNASYLDLGAYTGDTIDEFLYLCGNSYKNIVAFEPNYRNYKKLVKEKRYLRNTYFLNYASWNEETELLFAGKSGRMCGIVTKEVGRKTALDYVKAIPVDKLNISPTYVKIDVEGAERETLLGMKNTLNKCHPNLQISVYHMTDDFIEIPRIIEHLCPGYSMYLRHHPALPAWEIQLYCVYKERKNQCI